LIIVSTEFVLIALLKGNVGKNNINHPPLKGHTMKKVIALMISTMFASAAFAATPAVTATPAAAPAVVAAPVVKEKAADTTAPAKKAKHEKHAKKAHAEPAAAPAAPTAPAAPVI
jgi:hypothetical protein